MVISLIPSLKLVKGSATCQLLLKAPSGTSLRLSAGIPFTETVIVEISGRIVGEYEYHKSKTGATESFIPGLISKNPVSAALGLRKTLSSINKLILYSFPSTTGLSPSSIGAASAVHMNPKDHIIAINKHTLLSILPTHP